MLSSTLVDTINWERWSIYYKQAEKDKGLILLASDNEGYSAMA